MEIVGISALLKAFLQPAVCLIAPTQLAVVIVWLGAIASYETANHAAHYATLMRLTVRSLRIEIYAHLAPNEATEDGTRVLNSLQKN